MANVVPYAFPVELLSGTHNFANGGNQFTMSLYTTTPYSTASTVYLAGTVNGEVDTTGGSQYAPYAWVNTDNAVSNVTNYATVDWTANPNWGTPTPATFGARYAAIYNVTSSNKLVVILDFGATFSCSNGTFTVTLPAPTAGSPSGADAILSINS